MHDSGYGQRLGEHPVTRSSGVEYVVGDPSGIRCVRRGFCVAPEWHIRLGHTVRVPGVALGGQNSVFDLFSLHPAVDIEESDEFPSASFVISDAAVTDVAYPDLECKVDRVGHEVHQGKGDV
jgi:hypothetical protein